MFPLAEVPAFVRQGPAWPQLERLSPIDWAIWQAAAEVLSRDLGDVADCDRRIHHLYLPVLWFCMDRLESAASRPFMIGVQAPQGAGKTTLTSHLLACLPAVGLRGVSVSIDDFYLPRAGQLRVAAQHPGNPYLEHRGYPGTHDIELGARTLQALKHVRPSGSVRVPVYNKSAHEGRGDRAPEALWPLVSAPLDLVFVEGWMLGFEPAPVARLLDAHMHEPNRALESYGRWHRELDAFIVLRAAQREYVLDWRVEAEEKMKAKGLPGLSRAAIEDYVRRFLPAYAVWAGRAPSSMPSEMTMMLTLDAARRAS